MNIKRALQWLTAIGGTIDNAVIGGTTPNTGAFTTATASTAITDNTATTQIATTAFAKSQDAVLAREPDQGVAMTAAASGSSGITVADSVHIDHGTGAGFISCERTLASWTDAAILMEKHDDTTGYRLSVVVTTGYIKLELNDTTYTSTAAPGFAANTKHKITATWSPGATNTTVAFYADGVAFGAPAAQANETTTDNAAAFYAMGTDAVRTAGTDGGDIIGNFAPTAAEVLDMYRNGIPESWKWGSQTEQTSGTLVIGKKYRINNWITNDDFTNVGGANVDGTEFTATGTTPTTWTNSSTVVPIGATLALVPENIQPTKWIDATTNQLDATYPTTGYSFTRPFPKEMALVDPDVAHGMTTLASTDTFGRLAPISGTIGGLDIIGMTDATQDGALRLTGVIGAADPTDTHAAVHLRGGKANGTGWQAVAAAETVLRLSNYTTDLITVLGDGNVGIGTVSPNALLHIDHSSYWGTDLPPALGVQSARPSIVLYDDTETVSNIKGILYDDNSLQFVHSLYTSDWGYDERVTDMVIQDNGNVGIGTTDLDGTPAVGQLTVKGTTNDGSTLIFVGRDSDEANVITVDTDGDILNSAGVYGTISDEKLKANIKDATAKLSDILKVKVRHFNLKGKPDLKQLGVVAQELETVFPGMVSSTPDMERVPDSTWTPKTLKRQLTETKTVEKPKTEIVEVDGKYIQKTTIETVEETVQLFDEVPLYNESGEMLMQMVSPAKEAVLDEEGNEIEPAVEAVYAPVMHRIPRMEEYTETEDQRPMIVQPTGTVTKSVKTSVFIPMLIKAVQELTDRVEKLEK